MTKPRLVKPDGGLVPTQAMPVIKFNGLHLTADGLQVHGKPAFADYENAMACAVYLEDKAPFWKADLLEYGHTRADWVSQIDSIVDAGTFTKSTVQQYRYVSRAVPADERMAGLSFSHHEAVAALPRVDRQHYLGKAKREHLSVSALKQVIRREKPVRRVLKGQASVLAKAQDAVTSAAYEAAQLCREIPQHDCKDAEKKMREALNALDDCATALKALRKVQGKS